MATPDPLPAMTPGARRVLTAASALFYARGIHAVGVDAIAEAAGVTKKTLYDRFGSKDALVLTYLQERDLRWREHLEGVLDAVAAGGTARVLAVFDAAAAWSEANSPRGCSAVNARAETDDPDHPVSRESLRQKRWLLGLFERLLTEAEVSDPGALSQTLMLLYEGAIVTVGMGTLEAPFARARDAAADLLDRASS
ncbi:TetR/AcrR family transcriptional regulator [Actinotalea sp. BY-33]|uniref:TetR/AcrR family transcriptional regulator n=1 Tax=Actinotalea soli TaxID=2819234 RepID=A0A939LR00_9CELL|nr:TetR/AcrR family transcriptional regulator [Actinotalea soli]MBO1753117.1 TetR/AcrR family transcriptional regulator [Actinotalea soli]